MAEGPPGGGGDPYIRRFDGELYSFDGQPGALHRLYERGDFKILPRIQPIGGDGPDAARTYFAGVDILVGDVKIVVLADGKTHVLADGYHWEIEVKACSLDAPGHRGNTQDEPHPLQGVEHLNVHCHARPEDHEGESGLMIDGSPGADPAAYVVPG